MRVESGAHLTPKEYDMSSKVKVVRAWHDELYANPPSSVMGANAAYLSDDFQNLDQDGNVVMNKEAYSGFNQLIFAAFKDFKAMFSDLREEDGYVIMTFHFEGTHTDDLDMSAMGLGVIPASGKKIVWPEQSAKVTVEGDKIVQIEPYGGSGGAEDFLVPLGIAPSST